MTSHNVTILGAGPTGLSAALALNEFGHRIRILERNAAGTTESRAVGVNHRSLLHLESVGATQAILDAGEPLRQARFFANGAPLGALRIPQPTSGPPAIVALPQDVTEAILGEKLLERGIAVEWGTTAVAVDQAADAVTVQATSADGPITVEADYVLGADGSRSMTRKALGCSFEGKAYEGDWSLLDARVDWPWPEYQAAARFDDPSSVLIMVTLGDGRFRMIGNTRELEHRVRAVMPIHEIYWQNDFTLSERRVDRFGEGRVWLAGDAAHIHSPVGGMGMNLGIDDAFDFASSLSRGDLDGYNARRLREAKDVMDRADRGFRLLTATSPWLKAVRNTVIRLICGSPFLQRRLAAAFLSAES